MDSTVDFDQFRTIEFYGWKDNSDENVNRFNRQRIENAVRNELELRGLEVVDKGRGDLIVSLYVVTEEKTQTVARTMHMGGGHGGYHGYGPGYHWGVGHSMTTYQDYEYTLGTLVISVFDAKRKVLIWEATGKGTVEEDPKNADKRIHEAVSEIMETYPVKPLK